MLIEIQCPNPDCGHRYQIDNSRLERKARCSHCGETFITRSACETAGHAEQTPAEGEPLGGVPGQVTPLESQVRAAGEEVLSPPVVSASVPSGSSVPPPPPLRPVEKVPRQIGRFTIRRRLGAGAFGAVYLAHDPVLDREVALKVPRAGALASPEAQARFLREPKAAAQLRHPHIVPVYDAGIDGDHFYIASAFINGQTLEDSIEETDLDFKRSAGIVRSLAEALDYAHHLGIVHRDVKPGNVMIDAGGEALLMDFGLARIEDSEEKLTQDGTVLGTAAYMPPEQADAKFGKVGPASDQYSLGVVLYELLCGQRPFSGPPSVVIFNTLHKDPDPPQSRNPDVPRDLEAICLRAMAKDPRDRYADCGELAEDLRRYLDGEPTVVRPPKLWEQVIRWARRNPAVASLLAAVVGVTLLGLVLVTWQWRQAQAARGDLQTKNEELKETQTALEKKNVALKEETKNLGIERDKGQRDLYFKGILLAYQEWLNGDIDRAQQLLDACPKDLRDWEWRYLDRLVQANIYTLKSHKQQVSSVAYSSDGKWMATASWDRTVLVWDARGGRFVKQLAALPIGSNSVAFSADGKHLAAGGLDGTLLVWEVGKWSKVYRTFKVGSGVWSLSFAGDGKIAVGGLGNMIHLYDLATGTRTAVQSLLPVGGTKPLDLAKLQEWLLRLIAGEVSVESGPVAVAMTPDGKWLASAGWDKKVLLRDLDDPAEPPVFTHELDVGLMSVAISPDGGRVAVGDRDGMLHVWNWDAEQKTATNHLAIPAHRGSPLSLAFGHKSSWLASSGLDNTIKVWDPRGERVLVLRGHKSAVWGIAFSNDDQRIASASADNSVKIWNAKTTEEVVACPEEADASVEVALSRDGDRFAWASRTGVIKTSESEVDLFAGIEGANKVRNLALSPSGTRVAVAVAGTDGSLKIYVHDLEDEEPPLALAGSIGEAGSDCKIASMAFSSDGGRIAATDRSSVKVWDVNTKTRIYTFPNHTKTVQAVTFSSDGKRIASAGDDGTVRIWEAENGNAEKVLRGHPELVYSLAFSRDGRLLASASLDKTIKIWDLETGAERTLEGHTESVRSVAFNPLGTRLASASDDGTVRIWDATTGVEALVLYGRTGSVLGATRIDPFIQVAFGPGGKILSAASGDGSIRIWRAL